ncbi:MAG: nitroreductase family protein [Oscillospiraceae bacterium]|jgi:nitroreductase|nr:nitroreductase family protein [Oscillospiraceae bacterium]
MNEVLNCIASRYSCRDYTGEPLTKEQVTALVNAALASPSAMNRQPWKVIIITDKALIDEMDAAAMDVLSRADSAAFGRINSRGGKMYYNAPCMVMVASDGSKFADCDCGILSQNVSLAAHSMGLGSVICGMARIALESPRGKEFLGRMGFPEDYVFGMAVLVGKAGSAREPHELDMGKVSFAE